MADEETKFEEVPEEQPQKNSLLTLVLILNTLITAGAGYMVFMAHQNESNQPTVAEIAKKVAEMQDEEAKALEVGEAQETDGIIFPLDPFVANLAQGDGPRRFLRLKAVLKFSKESSEEEFKSRKPQIRDAFILIINSKRPEDLLKKEGKLFLKEELKAAINTILIDGKILDIFYVGFQVN